MCEWVDVVVSVFTRPTPPASSTAGPGRRLSILAVPEGAEQQIDILKKKIEEMVVPISLAYYFKKFQTNILFDM